MLQVIEALHYLEDYWLYFILGQLEVLLSHVTVEIFVEQLKDHAIVVSEIKALFHLDYSILIMSEDRGIVVVGDAISDLLEDTDLYS